MDASAHNTQKIVYSIKKTHTYISHKVKLIGFLGNTRRENDHQTIDSRPWTLYSHKHTTNQWERERDHIAQIISRDFNKILPALKFGIFVHKSSFEIPNKFIWNTPYILSVIFVGSFFVFVFQDCFPDSHINQPVQVLCKWLSEEHKTKHALSSSKDNRNQFTFLNLQFMKLKIQWLSV